MRGPSPRDEASGLAGAGGLAVAGEVGGEPVDGVVTVAGGRGAGRAFVDGAVGLTRAVDGAAVLVVGDDGRADAVSVGAGCAIAAEVVAWGALGEGRGAAAVDAAARGASGDGPDTKLRST